MKTALVIALLIAFSIALLFLSAVDYVVSSGAHLAVELTNNAQAQYYYNNALNQYAPRLGALMITAAVLLFILILALIALSVP
jgi:chromosome condensin MukBEF MukE localization factor